MPAKQANIAIKTYHFWKVAVPMDPPEGRMMRRVLIGLFLYYINSGMSHIVLSGLFLSLHYNA